MIHLSEKELAEISGYIKSNYGINLTHKNTLIEGRLGCYIRGKGFNTYNEYFDYVKSDPTGEEMANLINRLTTNHTFFMRESDHFEFIIEKVIPWIETLHDAKDMRFWSAGCATGEEPYGLSIYLLEHMSKLGFNREGYDTTILASDISERALASASEGVYEKDNLSALSPEWLGKYFAEMGDNKFRVKPELRKNVAFKKINLLEPFRTRKPFHVILCRNVMIYFDMETRCSIVDKFFDVMTPGGFLFTGHSESLTSFKHGFKYIKPSVYRKPPE